MNPDIPQIDFNPFPAACKDSKSFVSYHKTGYEISPNIAVRGHGCSKKSVGEAIAMSPTLSKEDVTSALAMHGSHHSKHAHILTLGMRRNMSRHIEEGCLTEAGCCEAVVL